MKNVQISSLRTPYGPISVYCEWIS